MRPPVPPFTEETARQKVQAAEDAWNTRDPERVAAAYTEDSEWRNRDEFLTGRAEIVEFLRRKWERELEYALRKDLWAFTDNRIAVRFQYECRDASGQWWRSYGNEQWEFDDDGLDAPPRGEHQRRRRSTRPTAASSVRAPSQSVAQPCRWPDRGAGTGEHERECDKHEREHNGHDERGFEPLPWRDAIDIDLCLLTLRQRDRLGEEDRRVVRASAVHAPGHQQHDMGSE